MNHLLCEDVASSAAGRRDRGLSHRNHQLLCPPIRHHDELAASRACSSHSHTPRTVLPVREGRLSTLFTSRNYTISLYTMLDPLANHVNYFFPREKTLREPARCSRGGMLIVARLNITRNDTRHESDIIAKETLKPITTV
uniref:Uncharacterized protein n=1 Tax=Timema genevievae TaxID=629358 RepID=A0A7R9JX97_TIMGE|nr:unnamed protein product [Timema genevievae]